MRIEIKGNWKKGFAYDVHTLDSTLLGVEYGHNRFETTRSEMGELIYQLKYCSNISSTIKIVTLLLEEFNSLNQVDFIIPIPSTNTNRIIQPVLAIAEELGKRICIPVIKDMLIKKLGGEELKNVDTPHQRKELLKKQMYLINKYDLHEKTVLLLDDLYRSGSTLAVATDLLYHQANVKNVFVLTMTKTRTIR